MVLIQSEPKAIKIWSTDIKKVMLWSTQIRPWWEVSSDTLAYRPLDTTNQLNDISWNGKNMSLSWTSTNMNIWTHNWANCVKLATNKTNINTWTWKFSNTNYTFAVWFYAPWDWTVYDIRTYTSDLKRQQSLETTSSWSTIYVSNSASWYSTKSFTSTADIKNKRILFVITKNGADYKRYRRGSWITYNWAVKTADANDTRSFGIYLNSGIVSSTWIVDWCYSNAVLESKLWTENDVNLYYNTFKSLYWIS